jgi:hypothetical protein
MSSSGLPLFPHRYCFIGMTMGDLLNANASQTIDDLAGKLIVAELYPVLMIAIEALAPKEAVSQLLAVLSQIKIDWISVGRSEVDGLAQSPTYLFHTDAPTGAPVVYVRERCHLFLDCQQNTLRSRAEGKSPTVVNVSAFSAEEFKKSVLDPEWHHGSLSHIAELDAAEFEVLPIGQKPILQSIEKEDLIKVTRAKARKLGRYVRIAPWSVLGLHALATILAAWKVSFHVHGLMAQVLVCAEIVLIVDAIYFWLRLRISEPSQRWTSVRCSAELLKSMEATLNLKGNQDFIPEAVRATLPKLLDVLRTRFWSVYREHKIAVSQNDFAKAFLKNRIQYQLKYYVVDYCKSVTFTFFITTLLILSWAALLYVLLDTVSLLGNAHDLSEYYYFWPLVLPVFSGLLIALPNVLDLNRRKTTYYRMALGLEDLTQQICDSFPAAETERIFHEAVSDFGSPHRYIPKLRCIKIALGVWFGRNDPSAQDDPSISPASGAQPTNIANGWELLEYYVAETNLLTFSEMIEYRGFVANVETS